MIKTTHCTTLFPISFQQIMPLLARIRVDENGCWIWTGARYRSGYGRIRLGRRSWLAHRFFYELLVDDMPDGLVGDHLCRVHACCNPDHIDPVTQGTNVRRGNIPAGPNHYRSAITHCVHGHPLSGDNLYVFYVNGRPRRRCRACSNRLARESQRRKRLAANKPAPPADHPDDSAPPP